MICKVCGAKNADTREKCFNCGSALSVSFRPASPENNVKTEKSFPTENTVKVYKPTASNSADGQTSKYAFSSLDKNNTKNENLIDEIYIDDQKSELYFSGKKKNKTKFGFNIAIWLLSVIFVVVAIFVGVSVRNLILNEKSSDALPNSELEKINVQPPVITKQTQSDGTEYLHCIFYGSIGDRVYLSCNDSYHTFVEESTEFDLYLEDLFPSTQIFTESTANTSLNASIVRGNKKYACGTQLFSISVPKAQYKIISPSMSSGKSYADSYSIRLWALPDSIITLNGNNITSEMDGTGYIEHEVETNLNSSTTYNIQVTQPYHTPITDSFIISRDSSPVKLTVSTNSAKIVSDKTVTVKGSTEQGVTITSDMPIESLKQNSLYNTYELTLDLSSVSYGFVETKIYATNEKGTTTNSYSFWYWPSEESITTSSRALNESVVTNLDKYINANILISNATVEKILDANKYLISASVAGTKYEMIVKCDYNRRNVKIGSTYKMYVSYDGVKENGAPTFSAWYII